MSIRSRLAVSAALVLAAFGTQAQTGAVRAEKNISLELANQIATATVARIPIPETGLLEAPISPAI